jgi:hypothetical protein
MKARPKGFPDKLDLRVHGIPVIIDYEKEEVDFPEDPGNEKATLTALYLKHEGFIVQGKEKKP